MLRLAKLDEKFGSLPLPSTFCPDFSSMISDDALGDEETKAGAADFVFDAFIADEFLAIFDVELLRFFELFLLIF